MIYFVRYADKFTSVFLEVPFISRNFCYLVIKIYICECVYECAHIMFISVSNKIDFLIIHERVFTLAQNHANGTGYATITRDVRLSKM